MGEKTRFYTLSVPSDIREKEPYPGYSLTPIFIEVMPVTVPERLARPQLVVNNKGQEGELLVLEQARWSSPFNHELRDGLASAIAEKLGAIKVIPRGRPPGQPVYRIAVELSQFDATEENGQSCANAALPGRWQTKRLSFKAQTSGGGCVQREILCGQSHKWGDIKKTADTWFRFAAVALVSPSIIPI